MLTSWNIETRRVLLLAVIMAAVGIIMAGVSIFFLYDTSFQLTGERLADIVQSRAKLMEAVAQHSLETPPDDGKLTPEKVKEEVLNQVRLAHKSFKGFGETGEFALGKLDNDQIVFVLQHRNAGQDPPPPVALDGNLAEPMRRALLGNSGILVGLDYRNTMVLAAYAPMPFLNMGVVAKIDMREIRAPFFRAGAIVFGIGFIVIGVGIFLFYRIGNPMVQQLQETSTLRKSRQELKETQDALREKAGYLDSILRASTDIAIAATDLNLNIKYFNPVAEKIFNESAQRVIGLNIDQIHRERGVDPERFNQGFDKILTFGEHAYEIRQTSQEGGGTIESRVSRILDDSGTPIGFVLMSRDVTLARQAQEKLERSEKNYRLLIESANDAIFIADTETGCILDANLKAGELLGRDPAEIVGMHQSALHPPEEKDHYRKLFQEHVTKGHGLLSGIDIIRQDGARVPVEIRAGVTDLGDRKVIQGIFRDVTQRLQLENELKRVNQELEQRVYERTLELERSNEDLQQFAYVASHDLQEPLRLINGYVQLLAKRYQGQLDSKADKYIAYVVESVAYMQALIQNLLTYSRVGAKIGEICDVNLDQVLDLARKNLRQLISDVGGTLTRSSLPTVRGDRVQLVLLFQNLIGNALKFRGDNPPHVHITAMRGHGEWILSVRDNGIGIEKKYWERIFLVFQKLHSRALYDGTGIGLALCKRIVQRHEGTMWVESELGQGSCFYFSIPDAHGNSTGTNHPVEDD